MDLGGSQQRATLHGIDLLADTHFADDTGPDAGTVDAFPDLPEHEVCHFLGGKLGRSFIQRIVNEETGANDQIDIGVLTDVNQLLNVALDANGGQVQEQVHTVFFQGLQFVNGIVSIVED